MMAPGCCAPASDSDPRARAARARAAAAPRVPTAGVSTCPRASEAQIEIHRARVGNFRLIFTPL